MALIDLLLEEQEAEIAAKEAANNYNFESKKESPDKNELWRLRGEYDKKNSDYRWKQKNLNRELYYRVKYYINSNSSPQVKDIDIDRIYNIARSAARCEVDNHYHTRHY